MTNFIEIPINKTSLAARKLSHGVGINDAPYVVQPIVNGDQLICPYYRKWRSVLERCYSANYHAKHPTYKGCAVVKEWYSFMSFRAWMEKQDWQDKHLDKDIIVVGNKIYSPETCCFVSQAVNNLITDNTANNGLYPQGVTWRGDAKKYRSLININGKPKSLGYYATADEAEKAYIQAKFKMILDHARHLEPHIRSGLIRHAELL